jgi:hypothetical protein
VAERSIANTAARLAVLSAGVSRSGGLEDLGTGGATVPTNGTTSKQQAKILADLKWPSFDANLNSERLVFLWGTPLKEYPQRMIPAFCLRRGISIESVIATRMWVARDYF